MNAKKSREAQGASPAAPLSSALSAPLARLYVDGLALAAAHAQATESAYKLPQEMTAMIAPALIAARAAVERVEDCARQLIAWDALLSGGALPAHPCPARSPDGTLFCIQPAGHDDAHIHPTAVGEIRWTMAAVVTHAEVQP